MLDAGSAVCLLFLGLAALVNLSRLRLVRLGERDTLNESLKLLTISARQWIAILSEPTFNNTRIGAGTSLRKRSDLDPG